MFSFKISAFEGNIQDLAEEKIRLMTLSYKKESIIINSFTSTKDQLTPACDIVPDCSTAHPKLF